MKAEQVKSALDGLPKHLRAPIELGYFGGNNYQKVAEILGQPEGIIKCRIRSGLGRLRVNLAHLGVQVEAEP